MDIDVYLSKETDKGECLESEDANNDEPASALTKESESETSSWGLLEQEISNCIKCELSKGRTQTVFGVGNPNADWLLVGEAPGAEEDKKGEPFIGRAGKLLDKMLAAIQLDRNTVYIANIVKCRPPSNRKPRPEEVEQCIGYLYRQIEQIQPKLILALGAVAASNLLNVQTPVGKLRGRCHFAVGTDIPLIVTYHPAYLLRSPSQKHAAWEDLKLACNVFSKSTAEVKALVDSNVNEKAE